MSYFSYMRKRDAVWDIILSHKVKSLPVKISEICRADNITVRSYKQAEEFIISSGFSKVANNNDGFAVLIDKNPYIFYNEQCSVQRQRFTVAHEYGHCVNGDIGNMPTCRNKEPTERDNPIETNANVIASRILAPSCVLWALNIHSAEDIARLCNISSASAEWRMKRLNLLYEREKIFIRTRGHSCFLQSPREIAVYNQFLPFILKNQDRFHP